MNLAYDVTGDGRTVVLLHSTVCDRRQWDPQIAALASAGLRVVRADRRWWGDTPGTEDPYSDAADVLELVDGPFLLVGSSGGGRTAVEIASRWPSRVTRLVLLCAAQDLEPSSPELDAFGAREEQLLEAGDFDAAADLNVRTWTGPRATDEVRAKVYQMQRHAFEVQRHATNGGARTEHDPAAITAPTLIVTGEHDLPDFRTMGDNLAAVIAGAERVHLDWAGHLPNLEDPAALNPLLVSFLTA